MDKPEGPTSHDVVARARRLFRTRAVGHTGTLDPFATGLLILVFGGATRLARWAERHPKSYRAVIRLGRSTDTDDRTGVTIAETAPAEWPSPAAVELALATLRGPQLQRPPAYSARKVDGERSHRLARRGCGRSDAFQTERDADKVAEIPGQRQTFAMEGRGAGEIARLPHGMAQIVEGVGHAPAVAQIAEARQRVFVIGLGALEVAALVGDEAKIAERCGDSPNIAKLAADGK